MSVTPFRTESQNKVKLSRKSKQFIKLDSVVLQPLTNRTIYGPFSTGCILIFGRHTGDITTVISSLPISMVIEQSSVWPTQTNYENKWQDSIFVDKRKT